MSQAPLAIDTSKPVLMITPGDIKINLVPNKDHVVELKLENLTTTPIAFKVKTTAPDKYQVRPIQSVVSAGETSTCMIVLKGMPAPLESMKHKFLIQSLPYDGETEIGAFWKMVESNKREDKRPTFHDQRIVCTLIAPSDPAAAAPAAASPQSAPTAPAAGSDAQLQSQLDAKTKEFDGLMDFTLKQNGQIKQLTTQLQQKNEENENLKRAVQQLEKATTMAANSASQNVSVPAPVSTGMPTWYLVAAFVAGLAVGAAVL